MAIKFKKRIQKLIALIKKNKLLALIIILGAIVRFVGVYPGYFAHGDEVLHGSATNMILKLTLASDVLGYPPFVPWLMLFHFLTLFLPISAVISLLTTGDLLPSKVFGTLYINTLYWGRITTAFYSTGAILLTYLLTKSFFNKKLAGLIAAFFVAFSYRLVLNSRVALPDSYNTFFFLLALLAIGSLYQKVSFRNYFLAFLASLLFVLVKYQFYILPPLFITHLYLSMKYGQRNIGKSLAFFFNKKVILSGLITLLIFIVAHTDYLVHLNKVLEINKYEGVKYGFGRNLINFFPISYYFHVGIGPFISIAGMLGIIYALIKKPYRLKTMILISALPIPAYLYLYYSIGGFYTRNFLALVPLICIFAAILIDEIFRYVSLKLKKKISPSYLLATLILVVIGFNGSNIYNSILSGLVYQKTSPLVQAKQWINTQNYDGINYGAYNGNPMPLSEKATVKPLLAPAKAFSAKEQIDEGFEMATISFEVLQDSFLWWMNQSNKNSLKFWKKPDDLLSQSYMALATREYLWSYSKAAFLTPWQAPGHNFAVVDLRNKNLENIKFKQIAQDETNSPFNWQALSFNKETQNLLVRSKDGKILKIQRGEAMPGAQRWQSPSFLVKPNHYYKATARIKTEEVLLKEQRGPFIRVDFYSDEKIISVLSRPKISFVSKRVYGDSKWMEVEAIGQAPFDAKYANISFQSDESYTNVLLDKLSIFESDLSFPQGLHITIPDNDLFLPNNGGFL